MLRDYFFDSTKNSVPSGEISSALLFSISFLSSSQLFYNGWRRESIITK